MHWIVSTLIVRPLLLRGPDRQIGPTDKGGADAARYRYCAFTLEPLGLAAAA
jgi:hypothetical protein